MQTDKITDSAAVALDVRSALALVLLKESVMHSPEVETMNSILSAPRSWALAASIAPLLVVTACAAARPPTASAPPTLTPGVTATQPAAPSLSPTEPTRGTIAISDEVRAACGIPAEDAFFAFDSATLESIDIKPLDAVARCLTTGPLAGRQMRLVGHADPRGPSE